MIRSSLWLLVGVIILTSFCGGCQQKFTRPRYDTIIVGMSEFEVQKTLGEPVVKFSDTWSYIHEEPYYKASIMFRSGRVTDKAWYDEKRMGDHPDSKWNK